MCQTARLPFLLSSAELCEEYCKREKSGDLGRRVTNPNRSSWGGGRPWRRPASTSKRNKSLSGWATLKSGEDGNIELRNLNLLSDCLLSLAVGQSYCFCASPSPQFAGTFEYSFYFKGAQLNCWHSGLENAFWPRGSALPDRANDILQKISIERIISYRGKKEFFLCKHIWFLFFPLMECF